MTEQHFFKDDSYTTPKNNLDRAIRVFARSMNRTLIGAGQLEAFEETFQQKVKELHGEHPRCKQIPLHFHDFLNRAEEIAITCGSTTCKIYKVSHYYPPTKTP